MSTTYLIGPAAGTSRSSGIASASVQNTKAYIGSAIDNATNLDAYADIEIVWAYGTNPTASKNLKVYLLYAEDGTNYEEGAGDGSTVTAPLEACLVDAVSPAADTNTHRKLFPAIPIAPYKFKPLVYNLDTGQTATVTLNVFTRKDQAVG